MTVNEGELQTPNKRTTKLAGVGGGAEGVGNLAAI